MAIFGSALGQLVLLRVRSFIREPRFLFLTFGFPVMAMLMLGVAFRGQPDSPVVTAIEATQTAAADRDALERSGRVRALVLSPRDARAALLTGRVGVIVTPGQPRRYMFDPTRLDSRLALLEVDAVLQRAAGRLDITPTRDESVVQLGSRYIDFLIPGLIGATLMQNGLWGIGFPIVELRVRRLTKRLVAPPMRKVDFLLSFVLMRGIVLLGELPLLLGVGTLALGAVVRGSVALLVGFAALGAFSFAAIGVLLGSRTEHTQTVSGLITVVSLPMYLGSGLFFSITRFPDAIRRALEWLPLTVFTDGLRAIMNDGAGVGSLARPAAILAAWGSASFVAALLLLRWR